MADKEKLACGRLVFELENKRRGHLQVAEEFRDLAIGLQQIAKKLVLFIGGLALRAARGGS